MAQPRDPRATYLHLIGLARDQAGTPEGDTAARLAEAMKAKYGPEAVETPPEPDHAEALAYSTEYERTLAVRIGAFLGLKTMKRGYARADGKGTRWRSQVSLEGPRDLVELGAELYTDYRKRLAELLDYVAAGYAFGAFPIPPAERQAGDAKPLTAAQLAAIRAGQAAGARDRYAPPIPEGRRLTTTTPRLED
jgi:hypothetical protein